MLTVRNLRFSDMKRTAIFSFRFQIKLNTKWDKLILLGGGKRHGHDHGHGRDKWLPPCPPEPADCECKCVCPDDCK